jgi:uncharacterized protein (TIGR02246 family)
MRATPGLWLTACAGPRPASGLPEQAQVHSCYEAGRDGWWLHRWLIERGIDNIVVDSTSIEVNRRARRGLGSLAAHDLCLLRQHDAEQGPVNPRPGPTDRAVEQRARITARGIHLAVSSLKCTTQETILNSSTSVSALVAALLLSACASTPPPTSQTSQTTEVCVATSEQQIAALFDRWNSSLQTGDPHQVVANYAAQSILLPTVSNKPRISPEEKEDYFHHFLENKPNGRIDMRVIQVNCNTAVDAGLYTFTFAKTGTQVKARYSYTYKWDGKQWLITSHHSSAMPE